MLSRNAILVGSMLAAVCAATVHAQSPSWNRRAAAIAISPSPAGGHDVVAYFEVDADDPQTTLDLSTEILILVNGTAVSSQQIGFTATPGGAGGCGTQCLTTQVCICCEVSPGNVICTCGGFIAQAPSNASLEPGDQIGVLLRPAPGALPEDDTSDDVVMTTYLGDDLYWNRRIASAQIVPASGGGGPAGGGAGNQFFDVWVEIEVEANYEGLLRLPAELEMQINGVPVATSPVAELDLDLAWTQCSTVACNDTVACVITPGYFGTCQPDLDGPTACACQYHPVPDQPAFPLMALEPDDEIVIILRPAPGALPELPGFPDEEDEARPEVPQPCLGDLDGDGMTNVVDLLAMLAQWGDCPLPCPPTCTADTNDDCAVDILDLLELLASWGPCGGPV